MSVRFDEAVAGTKLRIAGTNCSVLARDENVITLVSEDGAHTRRFYRGEFEGWDFEIVEVPKLGSKKKTA